MVLRIVATLINRPGKLAWHFVVPHLIVALIAVGPALGAQPGPASNYMVVVPDSGVYRIRHRDLDSGARALPSATLGLSVLGRAVPIFVADGGDGVLDPGDWIEFLAEIDAPPVMPGSKRPGSAVYLLELESSAPLRMLALPPVVGGGSAETRHRRRLRVEHDRLRVHFPHLDQQPADAWFWAKVFVGQAPTEVSVELPGIDPEADRGPIVRAHLQGWSRRPRGGDPSVAEHHVEMRAGGATVVEAVWDNRQAGLDLVLENLPRSRWRDGSLDLAMRVVPRDLPGRDHPMVDGVLLDWIEVDYPVLQPLAVGQVALESLGSAAQQLLLVTANEDAVVYSRSGERGVLEAAQQSRGEQQRRFALADAAAGFWVMVGRSWKSPQSVTPARPGRLRDFAGQVDYLIVAPRQYAQAIEPLAERRRQDGLAVLVVDPVEVYEAFGHGWPEARAIRGLVRHARSHWPEPRPRFLLLVGDATPDAPDHLSSAGRVPAWFRPSPRGYYVTDYGYAADEPGGEPEIAVGRLPAASVAEVTAMVEKILAYERAGPGPWRRSGLWISSSEARFRRVARYASTPLAERGFVAHELFAREGERAGSLKAEISEQWGKGALLVHFFGHGGRSMWSTAPPGMLGSRSMFAMGDVERIPPSARLPIVLGMSCYSAAFANEGAESLGERLLRIPGRGAIAVVAATWRNIPNADFGRDLAKRIAAGGLLGDATIGAQRAMANRDMREQYNLFGDPALRIAAPRNLLEFDIGDGKTVRLSTEGETLSGKALVEWIDDERQVVHRAERLLGESGSTIPVPTLGAAAAVSLRGYVWDKEARIDAIGATIWPPGRGLSPQAVDAR